MDKEQEKEFINRRKWELTKTFKKKYKVRNKEIEELMFGFRRF